VTAIHVLGLDLAGPTNHDDTAAVLSRVTAGGWEQAVTRTGLDDDALTAWLRELVPAAADLVVGLDAPLSYNPGGGDRPADRALRRLLTEHGLASGTVMAPTMTRMAYLTLRGVVVARTLTAL